MKIQVKKFHPTAVIPTYGSDGAAGADLYALHDVVVYEGEAPKKIRVGVGFAIPPGYEGEIRVRSSLAAKGMAVAQGTIDSDYRGEVSVVASMLPGASNLLIRKGERCAQIVFSPCVQAKLEETHELPETARGEKGWGSTGL